MPAIPCACGGVTNTAVSEHLMLFEDNKATECYAKWVDGKWVPGCGYHHADGFMKQFADGMIHKET